jgi:hypothetical protein
MKTKGQPSDGLALLCNYVLAGTAQLVSRIERKGTVMKKTIRRTDRPL